jgi:hypothetical protein
MKPGTPVLRSTRLLDQLRERIRYLHYSLSTENAYLHWVRYFILRQGQPIGFIGIRRLSGSFGCGSSAARQG